MFLLIAMNKLAKFILPTVLVALMAFGAISSARGRIAPRGITIEPSSLTVYVCTEFTVEIWVRGIPTDYYMIGFDFRVEWDPTAMEYRYHTTKDHGWGHGYGLSKDMGFLFFTYPAIEDPGHAISVDDVWLTITFHCLREGTSIIIVKSVDTVWLWDGETTVGVDFPYYGCTVTQFPPRPVGGVLVPAEKLTVLAPYLALIGLVGAVTAAVIVKKRRKA